MKNNKFVGLLTNAYRQMLFEQEVPDMMPPMTQDPAAIAQQAPMAPQTSDTATDVEKPKKQEGAITQENESFLIDLIAKSIFIELDDEEKYKVKNMQQNLSDETVNDIELQLLRRIKGDSYKILDINEDLFELSPSESREFLNKLIKSELVKNLEIGPGGGEMYLINLLITVLLRDFSLDDKIKVEEMLESIKEVNKNTLKTEGLLKKAFEKYAKI
jgi:hypothetical protein